MKFIKIVIILIFLQSCSLNNDSKYWNEHNEKKKAEQKDLLEIIKKSNDITKMSLDEYKIYIDDYTKKSKYPDITQ
ncbi:hypothetical protein N9U47_01310 [Candidatus Pelagibacter sp.]|nr:hypothetical protein [Candidatus Pelagibacter sp.]